MDYATKTSKTINDKRKTINDKRKTITALASARIPFFFLLDFELKKPVVLPLSEVNPAEILFQTTAHASSQPYFPGNEKVLLQKFPVERFVYQQAFEKVQRHLQAGNSFLVNLTFPTPITLNLGLQEIFYRTKARYKLWLRDELVCFSPETFVKINAQGTISTFPMKGTAEANSPDAAEKLLQNPKELHEHTTIVDLLRNDLSRVASQVRVEKFRYLEKIEKDNNSALWQVSSEIRGQLPADWRENLGKILWGMLPAGSISGSPKPKTLDIIREAEGEERGWYTGIFGIFDGEELDSGVLIRLIEKKHNTLIFRSGGGITAASELQNEYQEMIDKVYVPLL
jgi:para-aminobenzoate synthetase component I